jgi:hypothetical protein
MLEQVQLWRDDIIQLFTKKEIYSWQHKLDFDQDKCQVKISSVFKPHYVHKYKVVKVKLYSL